MSDEFGSFFKGKITISNGDTVTTLPDYVGDIMMIKNLLLVVAMNVILAGQFAEAQKIKVDKIKGNKAIVTFSGDLNAGDSFDLGSSSQSSGKGGAGNGPRNNLIGFSAGLSSLSYSAGGGSTSATVISATGKYGWNHGQTEYGFLGEFGSTSGGGVNTTYFGGGGFFDFDMVPNRPGVETVYGVGGQGKLGSANGGSSSYMYWEMIPSGFMKWFALKTSTCFRADLGLKYRSENSSPTTTVSGLVMIVGLDHYF